MAIAQDPTASGPLVSVAVLEPDRATIALPEGDYTVQSFDAGDRLGSRDEIAVETGWEKPLGHPSASLPAHELRLGELRVQADEGHLGPETATRWVRISTEINPRGEKTEVDEGATIGRREGSVDNWEITETSFSRRERYEDNGIYYYDYTHTFNWDAPPEEMEPGEEVQLISVGESSGSRDHIGFTGDTFEYSTDGAGLIYQKNDAGGDIKNISAWSDGVVEDIDESLLVDILVAPKHTRGTFQVHAFHWNRRGAWVRWTYEAQEREVPRPEPVALSNFFEGEFDNELPEVREECQQLQSRLFRLICDRAPKIEATVENLLRRQDAALQGLEQPRDCSKLGSEGERLGCRIGTLIVAKDVEGCKQILNEEARRICLLGIAGSFRMPEAIQGLGDKTLRDYVATTGDLSVAGQITDPLYHDQAVSIGVYFTIVDQLMEDSADARVPPANFCSRLRGGYDVDAPSFMSLRFDGVTTDEETASNRNFREDAVYTARAIQSRDPGECDVYARRIDPVGRNFIAPTEEAVRDFHRQDCLAVIADAESLSASQ